MYATFTAVLALAAGFAGYFWSRNFVRRRLRFVDAVRSPWVPPVVGIVAGVAAAPVILLPIGSVATALLFGIGSALGTVSGVRAIRRTEWATRHLLS